jgi:hypothetical protein
MVSPVLASNKGAGDCLAKVSALTYRFDALDFGRRDRLADPFQPRGGRVVGPFELFAGEHWHAT